MRFSKEYFSRHIREERYFFLMISLLFLCFFYPLIPGSVSRFLTIDITYIFILLSGIYAISEKKALFIIAISLALSGFGLRVLNYFLISSSLQFLGFCIYLIFFLLMAIVIVANIMKRKKVTAETIYGAICVYLLFGIVWTEMYAIIEMINPGSFLSGGENVVALAGPFQRRPGFENLIYYSFVTLTTLGYGDITPVSPHAKALSALEAVVGQLYIAVMIARLVGLHIVHSGEKNDDS